MGQFLSYYLPTAISELWKEKEVRAVMLGLDAAGKTTMLFKLSQDRIVCTLPTVGFNVESIQCEGFKLVTWDVCGAMPKHWVHFYSDTSVIIFVVSSEDADRFEQVKEQLHIVCRDKQLKDAILLVFANKQDLPNARPISEITDALRLSELENRVWTIQPCCATSGEGIWDGMKWISENVK